VKAKSLFDTLNLPQEPDGLRVLDQDGRQVFFCGWRLIVVRGSFSQTAARLGGAIHGPVAWSPALLQRLCRRHCGSGCGRGGIPGLGCCDAGGAATSAARRGGYLGASPPDGRLRRLPSLSGGIRALLRIDVVTRYRKARSPGPFAFS
jgi:hypothetical protein